MKMKTVSLHDVYRLIAGHSDYHGDDILSALTCIAEGKEVSPIRPMDVVSAGAYEQVAWERDLAVQQLKDYGVGLGQRKNENLVKVTHCADEELRQKFNAPMKLMARMPPTTLEELELRDTFFRQLHDELSCKMDGMDLVEEIPDIDLEE